MSKCINCPLKDMAERCWADGHEHARLCELAGFRDDYRRMILERSGITVAIQTEVVIQAPETADPRVVERERMADTPSCRRMLVKTYASGYTGYGNIAEWIGRSCEKLGLAVAYQTVVGRNDLMPIPDYFQERVVQNPQDRWRLLLGTPDQPVLDDTIVFTMWETNRLGERAVANLNKAKHIIVPCTWNRTGFMQSGVTVPITIVPLGCDSSEYAYREPHDGIYTFGMAGHLSHGRVRKGIDEGIAAFTRAFPGDERVRLSIKVHRTCVDKIMPFQDPRITVVSETLDARGMQDWYASIDCLLVPSKGEGWGLHTLQAMACGRPVIAARYGGTAEFFDANFGWELDYRVEPSGEFYNGVGDWCIPSEKSMIKALRSAHQNRQEGIDKGRNAAIQAAEFPWHRTARGIMDVARQCGYLDMHVDHSQEIKEQLMYQQLIKGCKARTTEGCGCGGRARCSMGRGQDGLVYASDCTACIKEGIGPK